MNIEDLVDDFVVFYVAGDGSSMPVLRMAHCAFPSHIYRTRDDSCSVVNNHGPDSPTPLHPVQVHTHAASPYMITGMSVLETVMGNQIRMVSNDHLPHMLH